MSDDGPEVAPWTGVRTFHPEMRLTASAPLPRVLDALAAGLAGAGFRVRERRADGFGARHTDLLGILAGGLHRTVLTVRGAGTGAGTTEVVVEAGGTGDRAAGRAARGLTAGVRTLRDGGATVTVEPWVVPPERRRGERR